MTERDAVPFEWAMRRSSIEPMRASLAEAGAALEEEPARFVPPEGLEEEYTHPAFEPILVIAGAMSIGFLADRIVRAVKDMKRGGLIIDARGESLSIIESQSLDRGSVLVFTADGERLLDSSKPVELADALRALGPTG